MPEEHPEALQIRLGQIAKDVGVDGIGAECLLVAFEAERAQPSPNIQPCHLALLQSARICRGDYCRMLRMKGNVQIAPKNGVGGSS